VGDVARECGVGSVRGIGLAGEIIGSWENIAWSKERNGKLLITEGKTAQPAEAFHSLHDSELSFKYVGVPPESRRRDSFGRRYKEGAHRPLHFEKQHRRALKLSGVRLFPL